MLKHRSRLPSFPGISGHDLYGSLLLLLGITPPYEIVMASTHGGMVTSDTSISIGTVSLSQAAAIHIDTLLVAGGDDVFEAVGDDTLVEWLKDQAPRTRRFGSTCTGTFLIAATGLLSGHRAATHWKRCEELQKRHPDVIVECDSIFDRDGPIWSSAGVTAGIDMAPAMIEEDSGRPLALEIARTLVVYLRRPGGQSQFSSALAAQTIEEHGTFSALHEWLSENLKGDLRVERLAEYSAMSPRNHAHRGRQMVSGGRQSGRQNDRRSMRLRGRRADA